LKSDYVVAAGADPSAILLRFADADGVSIGPDGAFAAAVAGGSLMGGAPVAYQVIGGATRSVPSHYLLEGPTRVGIEVGAYDPTQPLVIDPTLTYATYLGGSGGDSAAQNDLVVDSAGNAYVAGYTDSANFPTTTGVLGATSGGQRDAFVTKVNPAG